MNKSRYTKIFAATVTGLLLAACATTAPTSMSPAPVAAYRDIIDLAGRLSVNYQKDGKPETLSGKFNWSQKGERIDVALASPLGQTLAKISVTADAATLTQADQAPRVAKDIDSLTAQALGWSLPVSGLRDWLQGYATAPGGKRFTASPASNTVTTADGWRLTFVSWQDETAAQPAPKRIDAERAATATSEPMALRIVIDAQG
ncbi:outer membrane lipoprotein LolB [Massilia sp. RP-1-19]|uniref:Outer-membrane lipoprotein LolB n=1 Tax=Massilia polaris TaxID=2728846 RepID=A0A848HNS6_9BURK|nr:outer membrane lipoprotein LolB [Massilia polaris]NML63005.1 outer membrane lipoprotein LolB [Massilia polaris]